MSSDEVRMRLVRLKPLLLEAARRVAEKRPDSSVGDSQFRNLVQLCQEADVPEEIHAFIDYQAGRQSGWPRPFADLVQEQLKRITQSAAGAGVEELLALFAHFFGYVVWALKAEGTPAQRSGSERGSGQGPRPQTPAGRGGGGTAVRP